MTPPRLMMPDRFVRLRKNAANPSFIGSVSECTIRRWRFHSLILTGVFSISLTSCSVSFSTEWPAPGSKDTELGVLMGPEVDHGEAEVYTGVQARSGTADQRARRLVCAGLRRPWCASVAAAQLGEDVGG